MWSNRIWDEMDRLLAPVSAGLRTSTVAAFPALNLWEDNDNLYLEAELPGLKKEQIEITVAEGDQLTIAGERQATVAEGAIWHRQETGYGRFSRTVTLPVVVDANQVQAEYQDGVLTVTLPKSELAKPRRITVRGADGGVAITAGSSS